METLVVVAQHRNQYYSRSKPQGPARFGSSPSTGFGGINCRSFQTGTGILPTPFKSHASPVTKRPCSSSPKTPSRPANSNSDIKTLLKTSPKSTPIPINGKTYNRETSFGENVPDGSLLFSELWAGPTYSNSPPPSSLPIPKFSVRPKRTVSLHLPASSPKIEMHPFAKSAPSSPSRVHSPPTKDLFVHADSATKTLHRILNLNINDDETPGALGSVVIPLTIMAVVGQQSPDFGIEVKLGCGRLIGCTLSGHSLRTGFAMGHVTWVEAAVKLAGKQNDGQGVGVAWNRLG